VIEKASPSKPKMVEMEDTMWWSFHPSMELSLHTQCTLVKLHEDAANF